MAPLNIFITTWNTGLQGSKAQTQDLTSWLLPVLHKTSADPALPDDIPDLYVIAVQELLPVHLALSGLSRPVLVALSDRIQALLSAHATSLSPSKTRETFRLVSRVSHGGNALWVFARESTTSGCLGKALTARLGLYYGGMSNKGAVGIRLPLRRGKQGTWETLTFVCCHLEAHDHNIPRRNQQYRDMLSSLVFRPSDPLAQPAQIFHTSHLFIMGDLNYRFSRMPSSGQPRETKPGDDTVALEKHRGEMVDLDTLKREQEGGRVFGGLREGDLARFAPTYKRIAGKVDGYSKKRIPGYTDRILFASYNDPLTGADDENGGTATQVRHYNSTPETVLSDHKPVHAILTLPDPPVAQVAPSPHMAPVLPQPPAPHPPYPPPTSSEVLHAWKAFGMILDRLIGWPWTALVLLGFGNAQAGMGVSAFVAMVWGVWWSGLVNGSFSA